MKLKLKIKKSRIIFIALVVLICLSSIVLFYQKENLKSYVAKVNERKISLEELEEERLGVKLNNV